MGILAQTQISDFGMLVKVVADFMIEQIWNRQVVFFGFSYKVGNIVMWSAFASLFLKFVYSFSKEMVELWLD